MTNKKIVTLDSREFTAAGGNFTINPELLTKRIDVHIRVEYTGITDCTIDGDTSLSDYVENVRLLGVRDTIIDMNASDIKALAIMGMGTAPQDIVKKSASLTAFAELYLPIVVNQLVKSVQITWKTGFELTTKVCTSSGGLSIANNTVKILGVDAPDQSPYRYDYIEKAYVSGSVSETKTGIIDPLLAICMVPSANTITKMNIKKDSRVDILSLDSYQHFLNMIDWEEDIENFLSEIYYGAGTTIEAFSRVRRQAGSSFINFPIAEVADSIKFDIQASATGTIRLLFMYTA